MASAQTEATELSVCFGILGIENPLNEPDSLQEIFNNSLTADSYTTFKNEFQSKPGRYSAFIEIGLDLRKIYFNNVTNVLWTGSDQLPSTVSGAMDIFIPQFNTPISVKYNSNVVSNRSPFNLFVSLPSGYVYASRSEDWFIEKDYEGIQSFYERSRSSFEENLPEDVRDFYGNYSRVQRKSFSRHVKKKMELECDEELIHLYQVMCHNVATRLAEEFNNNLDSLEQKFQAAVSETLIREFIRMETVSYVLAGMDHKNRMALRIPDLTSWKKDWELQAVTATPALDKGQSEVNIALEFKNKSTKSLIELPFHIEIRWSHGKFCGNPESKLYKEFSWLEVPFFDNLLSS